MASAPEGDGLHVLVIVCPDGVSVGDALVVSSPTGEDVEILVPPGVLPGQEFEVEFGGEDEDEDEAGSVGSANAEDVPALFVGAVHEGASPSPVFSLENPEGESGDPAELGDGASKVLQLASGMMCTGTRELEWQPYLFQIATRGLGQQMERYLDARHATATQPRSIRLSPATEAVCAPQVLSASSPRRRSVAMDMGRVDESLSLEPVEPEQQAPHAAPRLGHSDGVAEKGSKPKNLMQLLAGAVTSPEDAKILVDKVNAASASGNRLGATRELPPP